MRSSCSCCCASGWRGCRCLRPRWRFAGAAIKVLRSAAPNGKLFPRAASAQQGLLRLVERLQARLGPGQVQQPVLCADHRPERSTAWQPALPQAGVRARSAVAAAPRR